MFLSSATWASLFFAILTLVSTSWAGSDTAPSYIAPFSLPTNYPLSLLPSDPVAQEEIRNTLAHYPLAIDGKNFKALDMVFTQDAVTNYSQPLGVISGLEKIESVLESSLAPVHTQHSLGTQVIEICNESQAKSVTYFTASHFGQGDKYGQVLYAYGQYQDDLVRQGAQWRIKYRTLAYMGPLIGNISVVT